MITELARISMFLKSGVVYLISSLVSSAIPFLLLPLLTRYLSPEQYGQLAMFNMLTGALAAVIGISANGAADRKFYDIDITKNNLSLFNGNCFIVFLSSCILVSLFLCFFDDSLAQLLNIPKGWIWISLVLVKFQFISTFRLGQWQVRGKYNYYGFFLVISSVLNVSLSLLFVLNLDMSSEGRVYAIFISGAFFGVVSFLFLIKERLIKFKFSNEYFIDILKFGGPLIPHALGFFLLSSVDRIFITKYAGLDKAGLYMVAASLGYGLNVMFGAINKAYVPWLFENLKKNIFTVKIDVVKKTYCYFFVLLILSIISFYLVPILIPIVVGKEYLDIIGIMNYIIGGQIFHGMYLCVTNYIFFSKKTSYLSIVTLISGLTNIVLLFMFVPQLGIKGAAIAFFVSKLIQFHLTWFVSIKVMDMPWFDKALVIK